MIEKRPKRRPRASSPGAFSLFSIRGVGDDDEDHSTSSGSSTISVIVNVLFSTSLLTRSDRLAGG